MVARHVLGVLWTLICRWLSTVCRAEAAIVLEEGGSSASSSRHGCYGPECTEAADEESIPLVQATYVELDAGGSAASSLLSDDTGGAERDVCSCEVVEEDCACGLECSEEAEMAACNELLGPCRCQTKDSCACRGHCPTIYNREAACIMVPGCEWSELWCQPASGLMW
eukprot:TRINITY_DN76007_c0_g1_i1.p1 TRINITY_DN76007_c0_g1~~TRINITY_DN76007_c0_g1_i1.p1  ORF type:complete len:168 (-),score=24.94 TRINITY_DN76007_c0_g1_i1:131-634(-)